MLFLFCAIALPPHTFPHFCTFYFLAWHVKRGFGTLKTADRDRKNKNRHCTLTLYYSLSFSAGSPAWLPAFFFLFCCCFSAVPVLLFWRCHAVWLLTAPTPTTAYIFYFTTTATVPIRSAWHCLLSLFSRFLTFLPCNAFLFD